MHAQNAHACSLASLVQALAHMAEEVVREPQPPAQGYAPAASALYTLGSICKYSDCRGQLQTPRFGALLARCATLGDREMQQRAERVQVRELSCCAKFSVCQSTEAVCCAERALEMAAGVRQEGGSRLDLLLSGARRACVQAECS